MTGPARVACPYKGLMPYDEEDAEFFFGREAETEIITANLRGARLTLLYGASGVGKSSVLRAGVARRIHRLIEEDRSACADDDEAGGGPDLALVQFLVWSSDPVRGLLAKVDEAVRKALGDRPVEPVESGLPLDDALDAWCARLGSEVRPRGKLLIVLDQFEEYFLYHPTEEGPRSLSYELPRLLNRTDLPVNVLISLREDALAKLDRFKGRIPSLFDNILRLKHLEQKAARQAIERPLDKFAEQPESTDKPIRIETALVDEVLAKVAAGRVPVGQTGRAQTRELEALAASGAIEAPYLQLVLTRLWEAEVAERSRALRLETYNRLGGAEQIVSRHLNDVINRLSPDDRRVALRVFGFLVTPAGSKIAQDAASLARWSHEPADRVNAVLQQLCGPDYGWTLRKISVPGEPDRFEIFHDVLGKAILAHVTRLETEQELQRERKRRRFLIGGLVVSVVLATIFALMGLLIRQQNLKLDQQNLKLAGKKQEFDSRFWLLAAVSNRGRPDSTQPDLTSRIVQTVQRANSNSASLSGAKVLWVDDNPDNNRYEREALARLGVQFVIATSTNEALQQLGSQTFNAIITDFARKDDPEGGYTLLAEVKKTSPTVPVIIYTGPFTAKQESDAKLKGAYGETNSPVALFDLVIDAIKRR
jgi:CheY-like chemotaxis protein